MKPHHDHGIISLCALRYCFGKPTYVPYLIIDYIKDNWKNYCNTDKFLFIKDTREALNNQFDPLDEHDIKRYGDFLMWMEEKEEKVTSEITKRTKKC